MDAAPSRATCDHHRRYITHLRKSTSFFASLSSDRLLPNLDVRDRLAHASLHTCVDSTMLDLRTIGLQFKLQPRVPSAKGTKYLQMIFN